MRSFLVFLGGAAAFTLVGFGVPGPQGAASGGGSFSGDLAGSTLTDGTNGYVTIDVPILGGVGSAANPTFGFSSVSGTGIYSAGSGLTFAVGSSARFAITSTNVYTNSVPFGIGSTDALLTRVAEGQVKLTNGSGTSNASSLACYNAAETAYTEFGSGTYQVSGPSNDGLRLRAQSGQYWYAVIGTNAELTINPTTHNVEMFGTGNLVLNNVSAAKVYLSTTTAGILRVGSSDEGINGTIHTGLMQVYGTDGTGDYGSINHDGTSATLTDNGTTFLSGNGSATTTAGTLTLGGALTTSSGNVSINPASQGVQYSDTAVDYVNGITGVSDNTATTLLTCSLPNTGDAVSGAIFITAVATDATDYQVSSDVIYFTGVNKAGAITASAPTFNGASTSNASATTGSWTGRSYTTSASTGTNFIIQGTFDSSLTTTDITVSYRVVFNVVPPSTVTLP